MTTCIKCHRPLKRASADGYGPVCRKTAAPIPSGERDLFGFDIALAVSAALARLAVRLQARVAEERIAVHQRYLQAMELCGVLP